MGKLQQFDGQAIEILDSPPPSPQLAPATPEPKAPPCYDSMDSQEKLMPKRPMSFRRISNLVRRMNCGDASEKTWPNGLQAFQVGGRYFCKAKKAFDSDEEILDTSLVNGPYDLQSEEEEPSKAAEEDLRNLFTKHRRILNTQSLRRPFKLTLNILPKLLQKLKNFRRRKFRFRTDLA